MKNMRLLALRLPHLLAVVLALPVWAAEPVMPDKPNAVAFPAQDAKFVRFVIHATNSSQEACIDELEVYGPDAERNLALADNGGKATASSCLPGHAIHQVEHLNDGEYGNARSWIAATKGPAWAEVELPEVAPVSKVVFSRDRLGAYRDRTPVSFEIRLSVNGADWETVKKVVSKVIPAGSPGFVPGPPPPPKTDTEGAVVPAGFVEEIEARAKDDAGFTNLALAPPAKPAASSLLPGHAIHRVAHLNDGLFGNEHSWISSGEPSWVEIDLGGVYWVYRVAFANDASGRHRDRAPTKFSILTATKHDDDSAAPAWDLVYEQADGEPVFAVKECMFEPVRARWVRIAIRSTNSSEARIDEIEVFGQTAPIPKERIGPIPRRAPGEAVADMDEQLRYAFLGEEHAWLKTYGRADISPALVPYNGRVKEYPRHVGDDRLPLAPLSAPPEIDGVLDDTCWAEASRGVVRVAWPYDFDLGPLIEHELTAGWHGDDVYLALRTNKLLSSHLAVVSSGNWEGCGVIAYTKDGLLFNTYTREGNKTVLDTSTPIDGVLDAALECCELRLPLALFPNCRDAGLRVGLGMGGKHTNSLGRPMNFTFSSLAIAEIAPCLDGVFRVNVSLCSKDETVTIEGNAPGLEEGLTLDTQSRRRTLSIPATRGPIGPEYTLTIQEADNAPYVLHLFRYDPVGRALALMDELVARLAAKGLNVSAEQAELAKSRAAQARLLALPEPSGPDERRLFFKARNAKRRLFFREPDLEPIERLLFVKRRPFRPSHNYSVILDAPFRPGGAICVVDVPRRQGRLEPGEAIVTRLFEANEGIARTPMADFDLSKVYFGYRPSADGYYHVMAMNPDGSGLRQLTDGPFHDYWPCPLPDGGIAFISTRCKARYLCWRPQAAVMFRMDTEGNGMRPLSFANLTEWAPSVMSDGRIIWTRSEYLDKAADFGHTLWCIRPDGAKPELIFGNDIIQPNGYANGREVPGTNEFCCTLISHFGDLNGPIALVDADTGRFNPKAITSLTPEVPWPGAPPSEECFRDAVPLARDYFLCAHAPRDRFGLYVIDRLGNRELVYADPAISSMCPTLFRAQEPPPVLASALPPDAPQRGEFVLADVYQGLGPAVERGRVKYLRVVEEVRGDLERLPNGAYRNDHEPFLHWYASPVDLVSGPSGWPTYVAKASHGLVPVAEDGSADFFAPAGKVLYFQALDEDLNELQRMRSVVQLQPGERRSCIGCHESRQTAPANARRLMARTPRDLDAAPWEGRPFSFEQVVQPVLDAHCAQCHNPEHKMKLDFTGTLDANRVPASYRTLITKGLVDYCDYGWNSGGCEKRDPLTFGTLKSRLWDVLNAGHHDVRLTRDEMCRIKTWIDLNCPLWPDYMDRDQRPGPLKGKVARAE